MSGSWDDEVPPVAANPVVASLMKSKVRERFHMIPDTTPAISRHPKLVFEQPLSEEDQQLTIRVAKLTARMANLEQVIRALQEVIAEREAEIVRLRRPGVEAWQR